MKNLIKIWMLLAACCAGNASAVSVVTNESAFLSTLTNAATDLFPATQTGFGLDFLPSYTTDSARVTFTAADTLALVDANADYGVNYLSARGGTNLITLTATLTGSFNAFGMTVGNALGTPASLTVSVNGDTPTVLASPTSTLSFVGLVSSTPIASVVFTISSQGSMSLDTTRVITGIAPVPEPGIAVLMGAGVLLMGAVVRRRRA